ncbi:ring u-box domain-containing protein [Nannochloropsis gaditana]|uniref:Ring u-box domain-containing protein n=1 Tax=Nannochloropsis gaditana TaxID=72520 RepID=W7TW00_9STRA|nr:ring u-box domain-containing protein [Nannochloropsis gaditana]
MGLAHSSKRAHIMKELERFSKPCGLYPSCTWEDRTVRKLILEGRIAPCFPGMEDKGCGTEECPICFLRYVILNCTRCCNHPLCTECYLQLQAPKDLPSSCPYCNHPKLQILYGTDDEEKMMAQEFANIRLYDLLSMTTQPVPTAAFSSGKAKIEGRTAWVGGEQAGLHPGSARPLSFVAASGSGRCADVAVRNKERGTSNDTRRNCHVSASRSTTTAIYSSATYKQPVSLATVKERHNVEEEAKKQHLIPSQEARNESMAATVGEIFSFRGTGCRSISTGRSIAVGRVEHGIGSGQHANDHFVMRRRVLEPVGIPAHLQHVEDLMLMEAIQRSLEDATRRLEHCRAEDGNEMYGNQRQLSSIQDVKGSIDGDDGCEDSS